MNVAAFLAQVIAAGGGDAQRGDVYVNGALFGPLIADGEWWRIVTSGFLHDNRIPMGLLHIGFNMLALYFLGPMLENVLGRARFLALYLVSGIAGSAGALALSDPLRMIATPGWASSSVR